MKDTIIVQFTADKGMDEAAMEGVAGGGGGDGLASGAISNFTSHVIRRKSDVIRHFWAG